ncbi:UvrD-helicase domain-containing protein [Deinococcus sp. SL84]|uniref:UvrD-helicase domain-containing protein n=1 Tax=Deinococcus sp. SL84 TaxID=2994663 RepID=UPI002276A2E1|nr:UvrD-helicase domain-containing protein [Deinococcus sp. SL84]MCY1703796.1 AAA family ATPase [Deinococcus sp. SL84]
MTTLFDHLEEVRRGAKGKVVVREKREPSAEQQAVLQDLQTQRRMIILAGPGSGKTTLLEMIADELGRLRVLGGKNGMLAFNKHIVKEVKKRFPPNFDVRTVSSLGDLIVRQECPGITFEPKKYELLTEEHVHAVKREPKVQRELQERVLSCLDLHVGHDLGLDMTREDWAEYMTLVDAPIAGAEDTFYALTHRILREGTSMVKPGGVRSFLDQTLAPSLNGWTLNEPYDLLLIDELQDLSRGQLKLLRSVTHEGSRIIGVGDPRQSLYAFTGADQAAMNLFAQLFGAQTYPLSISYRCPKRVIEVARSIFPVIEAAPGAREGSVENVSGEEFLRCARPGDLAIARTNAPLVEWCYQLIGAGVPALVRGKDVSRTLRAMAKDAACFIDGQVQRSEYRDGIPLKTFLERLDGYCQHLSDRAIAQEEKTGKDAGMRLATIADRNAVLNMVCEHTEKPVMGGLLNSITALFSGDEETSVILTTAHGAKGLEADTVWILAAEQFPCERAQSEAELYAEQCAEYVAYTRAKQAMYFVDAGVNKIPDHARGIA